MAEPLLTLDDLSKRFGETVAADGLSLRVEQGEIHAILGENGAGKSTLVKMIYGVLAPDAGTIRWKGERIELKGPGRRLVHVASAWCSSIFRSSRP